jgi:hypothetical protein
VSKWNNLLTIKQHLPTTLIYHIQPTDAVLAKLSRGNRTSPKIQLRTAIDTLRSTFFFPAGTEHRKIPKDLTPKIALIHPSWHAYMKRTDLPTYTPTAYATLSSTPLNTTKPPKRPAALTAHNIPNPHHIADTALGTMEIDGRKYILRQTIYHVNQWHIEHLAAKQLCKHINNGLTP